VGDDAEKRQEERELVEEDEEYLNGDYCVY
jgi:hypothetical protein